MKPLQKIISIIFSFMVVMVGSRAQNTFPANGNVGVGIQSPQAPLHVNQGLWLTKLELAPFPPLGQQFRTAEATFRLSALSSKKNVWVVGAPLDLTNTFNGSVTMAVSANYKNRSRMFAINAESPEMPIAFQTRGVERLRISSSGQIGIGAKNPMAGLHILTSNAPPGGLPASENGLLLGTTGASSYKWIQSYGGALSLNPMGNNVGIGTRNPRASLHILTKSAPPGGLSSSENGLLLGTAGTSNYKWIQSYGGALSLNPMGNNVGIGTDSPGTNLDVAGTTRTQVLQITGGSDLAEPFSTMDQEKIKPGAVLIIDPHHPGKLKLSGVAYDQKVAGVVSGANGVLPGITLTQEGKFGSGLLVALSGRVYVRANTTGGPIQAGDILTTSAVPGEAMKVADHRRAQGAIIGKAMSGLSEEEGFVLMIVSLQ